MYQLHVVLLWTTKFSNTYLIPVSLPGAATAPVAITFALLKIEGKSTPLSPRISNILLSVLNHQSLILTILLGSLGLVLSEHDQPCKFIVLKYVCLEICLCFSLVNRREAKKTKRKWAPAIFSHLL